MEKISFGRRQDNSTATIAKTEHMEGKRPARDVDRCRRRFLLSSVGSALASPIALGAEFTGEARAATRALRGSDTVRIARDFKDPVLELVRLLTEAAEIEHDLMVQYLYAAFSLKPGYETLIGTAAAEADSFLGVAVQEMQHLAAVNRLLVTLGAAPVLKRSDFPYEIDIYPFPFELEPLTARSLAKYVYCEAPVGTFSARNGNSRALSKRVATALGGSVQVNHVGTLYDRLIELLEEVDREMPGVFKDSGTDCQSWRAELLRIKDEGEAGHFNFFQSVFMGTHPAFETAADYDPWEVPNYDTRYPAYVFATNPTAYVSHPNTIADPEARTLAWLGNLTYWAALLLLDLAYRRELDDGAVMAQHLMMGPLWSLARDLPRRGYGLPFDPLSMGSNAFPTREGRIAILKRFLAEGFWVARRHEATLPGDFPVEIFQELTVELPT